MPKSRVALFIPCYINHIFPNVAMATMTLLERFGYDVEYPEGQTCCGQPFANSGAHDEVQPLAENFLRVFEGYDYIVAPSASCTGMVRHHYDPYVGDDPAYLPFRKTPMRSSNSSMMSSSRSISASPSPTPSRSIRAATACESWSWG